jgi:hypothetical protein
MKERPVDGASDCGARPSAGNSPASRWCARRSSAAGTAAGPDHLASLASCDVCMVHLIHPQTELLRELVPTSHPVGARPNAREDRIHCQLARDAVLIGRCSASEDGVGWKASSSPGPTRLLSLNTVAITNFCSNKPGRPSSDSWPSRPIPNHSNCSVRFQASEISRPDVVGGD